MKAKITIKVPKMKAWKKLPSHLVVTKVAKSKKAYTRKRLTQTDLQDPVEE